MLEYERIFQKGLMLLKQIYRKIVIFVIFGILKVLVLNMSLIFVMVAMIICKKLCVLIILLLYILREVLIELIFGI